MQRQQTHFFVYQKKTKDRKTFLAIDHEPVFWWNTKMYDYFINSKNLNLTTVCEQQNYSSEFSTETVSKSQFVCAVNKYVLKIALKKM